MPSFGIKIKDEFLDTYAAPSLSFELRNPAYLGGDTNAVQESFMFSITLPLTATNRRLLGNINRLDHDEAFLTDQAASIYAQNIEIFRGTLSVRSATPTDCDVYMSVNGMSAVKDIPLSDLPHDTLNTGTVDMLQYLGGSCFSPDLRDFIAFPVWNPAFYEGDSAPFEARNFQNLWGRDANTPAKYVLENKSAATPFLKISYLLKKIAQYSNLSLDNNWQTTRELRWLCAYNNRSIVQWDANGSSYTFNGVMDFKNHVSAAKVGDWLKRLTRTFGLGAYVNFFDQTLDIVPNQTILDSAAADDWSAALLKEPKSTPNATPVTHYRWAKQPSALPDFQSMPFFFGAAGVGAQEGVYQNPIGENYYFKPTAEQTLIAAKLNDFVRFSSAEKTVMESALGFLPNAQVFSNYGIFSAPAIRQRGYNPFFEENGGNDFDDRLVFFRGFADHREHNGDTQQNYRNYFPLASSEDVNVLGYRIRTGWDSSIFAPGTIPADQVAADVAYTGTWQGGKGLFNRWHNRWHNVVNSSNEVEASFALTIRQVRDFSFKNKIRVGNREYVVRSLRIQLTPRGIQPVTAKLKQVV